MRTDIDEWIKSIRSDDPMTFEDAYFGPRPKGPEVTNRLVLELRASRDAYTRGKFCELLGEMGDESAIPALTEELRHSEASVREWAARALEEIRSEPRRTAKAEHLRVFKARDQ